MLYEGLANLIEENIQDIARQVAKTAIERKSPLAQGQHINQLAARYIPILEVMIRYLRSGNAQEWSSYVGKISSAQRKAGYTADQVNTIGNTMTEIIMTMVNEKLPGPQHEAERERYARRMQGLTSLAGISSVNAHMKKPDGGK